MVSASLQMAQNISYMHAGHSARARSTPAQGSSSNLALKPNRKCSLNAAIGLSPVSLHEQRHSSGIQHNTVCRVAAFDTMEQQYASTAKKALDVNLDPSHYGSMAEIGAGQEVARWFFRVGGAAGTIAKSISAYDMSISDSMYGACARYVTRDRLEAMLDYEYLQCNLTLRKERGDKTAFFAFADTVVAKAYNRNNECHGWLGLKYQSAPKAEPNTVLIHVRMLEDTAQLQAEALGILGVNLIHGALTKGGDYYAIISGLLDDLTRLRVEVDLVSFNGPDFGHVDDRFAALTLVQKGLCDAALFSPAGQMLIPQEALRKQNVLLVRGRFRPFTLLHNDMLQGAASQFFCDPEGTSDTGNTDTYDECVFRDDTMVLLEMTTRDMMEGGDLLDWTSDKGIQMDAFIQRIDALSTMGYTVLLSSFRRYFKLASYLSTHTNGSIVIAMGVPSLKELFTERHYADLDGGILEGFGRLLKFDLRIYVYPTVDATTGKLQTAGDLKVSPKVQKLFEYILDRRTIVAISSYNRELLMHSDVSKVVTESIRAGTTTWESLVPRHVVEEIKTNKLLGWRDPEQIASATIKRSSAVFSNGASSGRTPAAITDALGTPEPSTPK